MNAATLDSPTSARAPTDATATTRQVLSFWLGEQQLAVGIAPVREIIQFGALTRVPLMPGFVRGVINLRGAVVPVIDLAARLGRGSAEVGERSSIVVFEHLREGERVTLGLLVDAVSEVIEVAADQVEPPPRFGGTVPRAYVEGLAHCRTGKDARDPAKDPARGDRVLPLLDVDAVLDVDDMARRCEAALAADPS